MNSSIQELKDATWKIQDLTSHGTDATNALSKLNHNAYHISEILSKSNPKLSQSWENVSDTFFKINASLTDSLTELIDDLYRFIDNMENNERMLADVLDKTISLSQNILNKLSITE